ncbi:MAG: tyrosine--tRNA ligase, partial [Clostridia bacterium]|nr:tyrosine--tRNA ligase [Clostridia bacterium]
KWDDSRINEKKEILAYELTALVHGKEEADKAKSAAQAIFSGVMDDENMPTTEFSEEEGEISLIDLMVRCKLASSNSEARRLITQGGVTVNQEKETDFRRVFSTEELKEGVVIKKGKKVFHKAVIR